MKIATETGYWLAVLLFLLAMLSKASVVVLPVVLLGLAWRRRRSISAVDLRRTAPLFGIAFAFALITVQFQHGSMYRDFVAPQGPIERWSVAVRAMVFYLQKAVFPVHMSMVYPRWLPQSLWPWGLAGGLLAPLLVAC